MQKKNSITNNQKGFTLIEMLISIALFSIIAIAGYSSLSSFSKSSKNIQNSANKLKEIQTLTMFFDRDFSQIFNQQINFKNSKITITSIQNNKIIGVLYDFNKDKIVRIENENELVLIDNISKIKVRLLDEKNKWHSRWTTVTGKNQRYIKVIEVKFDSSFGEIIKMVMIDE
jgi:general secretion pathway protein J